MSQIPDPIFKKIIPKIEWMKIYAREYGVQYSECAILCLSPIFKYHIPKPSTAQIVIPEENNTAFYIDKSSWDQLVESLNNKYTTSVKQLEAYEKQFIKDGNAYLEISRKISIGNLTNLTNNELKKLYLQYQIKLLRYSVFAWTSFILNNYISEKATTIVDKYLKQTGREKEKPEILNSLFKPQKLAAVLSLQKEAEKTEVKLSKTLFNNLYEKYKWLSSLDIHNDPWTQKEFKKHLKSFTRTQNASTLPFPKYAKELKINSQDREYLSIAQRFVYIKDARDDFRRKGVFLTLNLFEELGNRMGVKRHDISYLLGEEITDFLDGKISISSKIIKDRQKAFVMYLDEEKRLVCLSGKDISKALSTFGLAQKVAAYTLIVKGTVASRGKAKGIVAVVKGVKDLTKVKKGYILVAVTTHPDYVPAMRRAAAIVTDEGGITSHAAIVSREFGIPCIVGTKTGTSVFKDGDRVEVDAETGSIKKI